MSFPLRANGNDNSFCPVGGIMDNAATIDYSVVGDDDVALELSITMWRCKKSDMRANIGRFASVLRRQSLDNIRRILFFRGHGV
jgi:hypothetical protein